MFGHRITEEVSRKTYFDWFLLSFLAGSVNAGGWMGAHRFVSHVTGFATLAGYDAAIGNWREAIGILTVPIYFLGGVVISAYLVDRRIQQQRVPRYDLVMGLITGLLLLAGLGGHFGMFGIFGHEVELRVDYFFLALLCAASGLQNSAVTSASSSTLRTTHLTGITTDLGIGLVRLMSLPKENLSRYKETKVNILRVATIFSFMAGSGVGAFVFLKLNYLGFLLPAGLAFYATLIAVGEIRIDKQDPPKKLSDSQNGSKEDAGQSQKSG